MSTYLLTGATGFVGSHVLDRLLAEHRRVRAIAPEPEAIAPLRARGVDACRLDLCEDTDLARVVEGAEIVLHCAGLADAWARREELWSANAVATANLVDASIAAGVSRFVHVSSTSVYGRPESPVRETAPKQPVNAYGESKWAAERALWERRASGLRAVVLRPCLIYGERDPRVSGFLLKLMGWRWVPLPEGGRHRFSVVHVDDVVEAILAAARSDVPEERAYNVTDGASHTYREVVDVLDELTGMAPTVAPVPGWLLVPALALAAAAVDRGAGASRAERSRTLEVFARDLEFSTERARAELGYRPRVSLVEGMARTIDWTGARVLDVGKLAHRA